MKTVGSKRSKAAAATAGVAALLALSACSGDSGKEPVKEKNTSAASTSAPATEAAESPSPETDSTETATPEEATETKASSEKGTDPVLGHSFEVTGIALGIQGSGQYAQAPGGAKYVAVKIKATTGAKYYNGLSCSAFKLWDDQATTGKSNFSLIKDDLEKAGLPEFERISRGKSGEGWCAYYLQNPTKDNLTVEYSRLALKDSSGKITPALSKKLKVTPQA